MVRIGFKMKLFAGCEAEYKKRHDEIWPELASLLTDTGIAEYSIFHDKSTNDLFAVLKIADPTLLAKLPAQPIMQKWWTYMGDIMESNADNSPISTPLDELFYLP
ncbi:MAG: L-rhamnose mutarotase [Sphingobacteriales bacterium]|nr:MAG: L-rhamnose mutarotase [Sphingobacteriales bacterium]